MLTQELDFTDPDTWYVMARDEIGGSTADLDALYADIMELSRDDVHPFTVCPTCGRPLILSCYSQFTMEDYPPELYTVTVRGVDYCCECADSLR